MTSRKSKFDRDWKFWHQERVALVTSPHGPAALTASWWLSETPSHMEGFPGRWRKSGEAAVGTEMSSIAVRLNDGPNALRDQWQLKEGDVLRLGDLELRTFVREGAVSLRIFDPKNPPRKLLSGIETFAFDPSWIRRGTYRPASAEESVATIETIDGRSRTSSISGTVDFQHPDGTEMEMIVQESALGLHAVFSDSTSGSETYRFRFLDLHLPEADGTVTIDLNRAHLPPCAFSDHFACPFPSQKNQFQVGIRAGERAVLLSNQRTTIKGLMEAYNEEHKAEA